MSVLRCAELKDYHLHGINNICAVCVSSVYNFERHLMSTFYRQLVRLGGAMFSCFVLTAMLKVLEMGAENNYISFVARLK